MRTKLCDGPVRIRQHRDGDLDALYEAIRESIAELGRWLPWCHEGYSQEDTRVWLARQAAARDRCESYEFLVEDVGTGRALGGVGINMTSHCPSSANLGYWVRTSAAGRGVASAAVRLAVRFALEDLHLVRVQILVDVENVASQRVAEKAGAKREGILRNGLVVHGRPRDVVCYSIILGDI